VTPRKPKSNELIDSMFHQTIRDTTYFPPRDRYIMPLISLHSMSLIKTITQNTTSNANHQLRILLANKPLVSFLKTYDPPSNTISFAKSLTLYHTISVSTVSSWSGTSSSYNDSSGASTWYPTSSLLTTKSGWWPWWEVSAQVSPTSMFECCCR
jgi:hypothetical protein